MVSLPKEWIDANNLDKTNQVEIETNQNNLSIRTQLSKRPSKEIEISYPLPKGESIVPTITVHIFSVMILLELSVNLLSQLLIEKVYVVL